MNYPPNNSSKFSYNTNRSMISETMFSNFTNVSEEKHKSIKINNFENIPKQMGKLNAPKIQNNNNLYGNIPKKNYNGMYPYIKYESDILKKSYIPQKLDFSKNINISHPLSKSINISNKSASTIINNSDYGEFTSLTENSYNKNNEFNNVFKSNISQNSYPSTSNQTCNYKYKDNYQNHICPKNSYFNNFNNLSRCSTNINYKNFKNNKSIISY